MTKININMNTVLPSWNDTPVKQSILDFVNSVTTEGSEDFVQDTERIAVFDNDGTLWAEQPVPNQLFFAMDRIKFLADQTPAMKKSQPFKAFLEKDIKTISTFTKRELFEFVFTARDAKTKDEFEENVSNWFKTAKHPRLDCLYTECIYQPQLELLEYLRMNGFKTYIVSGGGINFMRVIAEQIYGIPPEQVIGSSIKTKIEMAGSNPVIVNIPELNSFDDREVKILNIDLHIGRRPVFVFGNSDGDLRMLQYALHGKRPGMALLLHHDDAEREFAYDKDHKLSPLNEALKIAENEGITVVRMKNDWKNVFSFD